MRRKRSTPIIFTYVLSLVVSIALLVIWVIYAVNASSRIEDLAGRLGLSAGKAGWITLAVGCGLLFLLLIALTYQLAQALAARRYALKQEELIASITHELKSPLAAIKLHGQTLQETDLDAEQRQRSVEHILTQVDRMGALVDDVLESARLLVRGERLTLTPVAIGPFFNAFLADARRRVEAHGLALRVSVTTSATVLATEEALERVVGNLLDNAVRFSTKGGEVRCRVEDVSDGPRPEVRITVEDDGIGIPKGELSKIFDRFYQIRSELGGPARGTGLGLFIVSGLVEKMQGTIRAVSHEGRPGARFLVTLPVARET